MLQLGQRTFTHNTAGVPIIVACTIEDSVNGLVGGEAYMGGLVKEKGRAHVRDHADTAHSLVEMYVSPRAYSFHFSPQASPTRHRSRWPFNFLPICAPCVICISNPFPQRHTRRYRSTSAQPIPFRSQAEYTRRRPHRRASGLRAGMVGARSWCCATTSTRKCGVRHGGIDSDSDSGAGKM